MGTLWLVEHYVISCCNHPIWGDYNTEALIFKMAVVRFLCASKEAKKYERKYSCLDNHLSSYTKNNFSTQFLWKLWNNPHDFVSRIYIPQYSLRLRRINVKYFLLSFSFFSNQQDCRNLKNNSSDNPLRSHFMAANKTNYQVRYAYLLNIRPFKVACYSCSSKLACVLF